MILEMVMESLFAVVDIYFVSLLGSSEAVATVGLTESVLTIIYSLAIGLSMGATAIVARRIGEKDKEAASSAAFQTLIIGTFFSILISLSGIFYGEEVLKLMGASDKVIEMGGSYTRWMLMGNLSIMLLFVINGVFRGAGDAVTAMRALWIANLLNMVLDPLFIFGFGPIPAFGVEGAAIATNIGRGLGVVYQLVRLFRKKGSVQIRRRHVQWDWPVSWNIIKISAGGAGQFLISSASWVFLMRILSDFGSEVLAGYTIGIRVVVFTLLPSWGLANAAATLVGQHLGAGMPDRAEASVWRTGLYNTLFLGFISLVFFFFSQSIMEFFTQDEEVIDYGKRCLVILALGYLFYGFGMVIIQSFNGAGDTRTPTFLNFVMYWLFQVPIAYMLAYYWEWGPDGVFASIPLAETFLTLVSLWIFRAGKWKAVKV